jgi:hypothetical protein
MKPLNFKSWIAAAGAAPWAMALLSGGCGYPCPDQGSKSVQELEARADVGCPSLDSVQQTFSELGYNVVSLAGSSISSPVRQVCWYRITDPAATQNCSDQAWQFGDPPADINDVLSRTYYRSQMMDPNALDSWEAEFSRPVVISCDAGGQLYGSILPAGTACPAAAPPDDTSLMDKYTLGGLGGMDEVPAVLSCQYNMIYHGTCSEGTSTPWPI